MIQTTVNDLLGHTLNTIDHFFSNSFINIYALFDMITKK